jgi:hypothetical protein
MQHLDLSDDETTALAQELYAIVENDRYPLSSRIRTLREILAKLLPEPAREPLPPPKVFTPPRRRLYLGVATIERYKEHTHQAQTGAGPRR